MKIPYVLTEQGISYFTKGRMCSLTEEHPLFNVIKDALSSQNLDVLYWLSNPQEYLDLNSLSEIKYVEKEQFTYKDLGIPYVFMHKVLNYSLKNKSKKALLNFLEKVSFFPLTKQRENILKNIDFDLIDLTEQGNLRFLGILKSGGVNISSLLEQDRYISSIKLQGDYGFTLETSNFMLFDRTIEVDPRFLIKLKLHITPKDDNNQKDNKKLEFYTVAFKSLKEDKEE